MYVTRYFLNVTYLSPGPASADPLLDSSAPQLHLSCAFFFLGLLWTPTHHALQGNQGGPTSTHHKPAGQLSSCRWTLKGERGCLKLVQLHLCPKVHVHVVHG